MDDVAVARDPVARDVDVEVADAHGRRARAVIAAQAGAHAGDELARLERFGHVIVGAGLEPQHHVDGVGLGGQHDDRHARLRANLAADVDAALAGQHEVQQHHVRVALVEDVQGAVAVVTEHRLEPVGAQDDANHLGNSRVVVDHQYSR